MHIALATEATGSDEDSDKIYSQILNAGGAGERGRGQGWEGRP